MSKVSEDQLFYLMSRGLTEDEAMAMVVRGFVEPIAKELPMEYALELNRPAASNCKRWKARSADGGAAGRSTRVSSSAPSTSPHSRFPAAGTNCGGSLRCAGCGLHDGSAKRTADTTITVSEQARGSPWRRSNGATNDSGRRGACRPRCRAGVSPPSRRHHRHRRPRVQTPVPVEVTITGPGVGQTAYGHLQIRAGELAEAVVVIDLRGSGTYADNVEFVLADAARMTVVWIADWADDMVHLSAQHARLGKDAVLRHVAVTLGGDVVRMAATVRYDAPGGDAELLGLYFADAGQHLESRLLVDHSQPNCRSNVLYKGRAAR